MQSAGCREASLLWDEKAKVGRCDGLLSHRKEDEMNGRVWKLLKVSSGSTWQDSLLEERKKDGAASRDDV